VDRFVVWSMVTTADCTGHRSILAIMVKRICPKWNLNSRHTALLLTELSWVTVHYYYMII